MIIQIILDAASYWVAGAISLLPPTPQALLDLLAGFNNGVAFMIAKIAPFGVILPFVQIGNVLQWWIGLLAFWALTLPLKLVLWLMGR